MSCLYYRYEYHWADKDKYKKPTKLPAPQYISLLMDWVEEQINNEEIFPATNSKHIENYWGCLISAYSIQKYIHFFRMCCSPAYFYLHQ